MVNRMDRNGGQAGLFFENPEVRQVIQNPVLDQVYDRIRASRRAAAAYISGQTRQQTGFMPGA